MATLLPGEEIRDKEAAARLRECFDGARTHLRAGTWRGLDGAEITVVGSVWDLHGTVCTCCPRKPGSES